MANRKTAGRPTHALTGKERDPLGGVRVQVLVLYYSRFGLLHQLAQHVAEGAREVPGTTVKLLEIEEVPRDGQLVEQPRQDDAARSLWLNHLVSSDALVVGGPAYFGSMASAVRRFFEDCLSVDPSPERDGSRPWRLSSLRNKVGAAFTASATPHGGNELALQSMLTFFMHVGMLVVTPGMHEPILENATAPYGATTIAGPQGNQLPTRAEQDAARELGRRVAEVARWLKVGRLEADRERHDAGAASGQPKVTPTSAR